MSYKVQLSKEEINKANEDFLIYQSEYNKTHNPNILWFKMEPLIRTALAAAILKSNCNNEVKKNFEDKLENGIIKLIRRYVKNPNYHQDSLPTFVHYGALLVNKTAQVIWEEQNFCQFENEYETVMENDYE